MVPSDFAEEVRAATPAKLILLKLEIADAPWVAQGLDLIAEATVPTTATAAFEHVVLFSGHRPDSPGRQTPRFPPDMEAAARRAIRAALLEQQKTYPGPTLAISGGASGGDLLFLEVSGELGVPSEMLLALPVLQFVKHSVQSEDDDSWVNRFYRQLAAHPNAPVLSESAAVPEWLHFKQSYDIWQRNNLWLLSQAFSYSTHHLTLIALWDGASGDGAGGTENMVRLAKEHGAQFVWLNTKELVSPRKPHEQSA